MDPKGSARARALSSHHDMSTNVAFCCYLQVIPLLFIFFYHAFPTTVLLCVAVLALMSLIPLIFNRGDTVVSEPAGPALSACMVVCVSLMFLGSMRMYWGHVQPMRALITAREYQGVYPQLPSAAFVDAAFLKFTGNTSVDLADAVSVKSVEAATVTFCAAPVKNRENTGRVEFWAIGVGCCGDKGRGKFECDDAGKKGAFNAYVIQNPVDPLFSSIGKYIAPAISRRDIFMQAIAKAERTKGLTSSKEPMFVRWTSDSKDDIIAQEAVKIVLSLIGWTVFSVIMSTVLTRIQARFTVLRIMHRFEKTGDHNVTARLHDFLSEMQEHHREAQAEMKILLKRPAVSKADMCLMGIVVPYIVLMLCVLLTTYSSCWRNGHLIYAPFLTLLGIFILALLVTPGRGVNGLFFILVATVGLYIGAENYNSNMYHYCSIEDKRSYSNVTAGALSSDYKDGGILNFKADAYLSQNFSVGFLYKDVVYCAAPIISQGPDCVMASTVTGQNSTATSTASLAAQDPSIVTNFLQRTSRMHTTFDVDAPAPPSFAVVPHQCKDPAAPKRIEFWAIGINCCNMRGDFRCDGGKDTEVHSSVVVRDSGSWFGGERAQFFNAVSQSVAAYDLPSPDNPVLIRWGKDPKKLQGDWANTAGGVILLTAMIGLLSMLFLGIVSFFYMRKMRKAEEQEEQEEVQRTETPGNAEATPTPRDGTPRDGAFFSKARASLRV